MDEKRAHVVTLHKPPRGAESSTLDRERENARVSRLISAYATCATRSSYAAPASVRDDATHICLMYFVCDTRWPPSLVGSFPRSSIPPRSLTPGSLAGPTRRAPSVVGRDTDSLGARQPRPELQVLLSPSVRFYISRGTS